MRATRTFAPSQQACRFAGVSLLTLLCVVAFAGPAQAHAVLSRTSPGFDEVVNEQPERVVANFSEPVEINFGALRVFGSNGERVDTDDSDHVEGDPASIAVGLEPDLADGTYTATYRVISADSHVIDGAFVWHLGAPGVQSEGIADELLSGERGDLESPAPYVVLAEGEDGHDADAEETSATNGDGGAMTEEQVRTIAADEASDSNSNVAIAWFGVILGAIGVAFGITANMRAQRAVK